MNWNFVSKNSVFANWIFFDSSFTIRKQRVIEICNEIRRRKLDIVWAARTRVDCITDDVLKAMRAAGCTRIYYGIESGNREILQTLKNPHPSKCTIM